MATMHDSNDSDPSVRHRFFPYREKEWVDRLGKEGLASALRKMWLVRHFEMRAESAYQHGWIGGFFHSYIGQEAIQIGAVQAMGKQHHWWVTTYRCHALPLLLDVDVKEVMAELYGKATGNALGRGGSMHLYAERLLGGFGIVGGHLPVAAGAAFSLKYQQQPGIAICFLGEGAVAQGTFHESLNLASLWKLPSLYVIENNRWGMGTHVSRALVAQPIAENFAKQYDMECYVIDGMDYLQCYATFSHIYRRMVEKPGPILVEAMTERFRGHSISDPGFYRSKEELQRAKERDPIMLCETLCKKYHLLEDEEMKAISQEEKERVIEAITFAEDSPCPNEEDLEKGVFAT